MYWLKGNAAYGFTEKTTVKEIDAILHNERINHAGNKVTYLDNIDNVPAGSFVFMDEQPWLIAGNYLHHWTAFGYDGKRALPTNQVVTVLTPRSVVNTFSAGYLPQMAVENI
ncbi:hypothetical protein [Ginsengibacter hankyongi]|uniref:hypothetical protein n=1 Tax=Ginsengibacter hankyongi TaxID=2607284 RepID=UPI001F1E9ADF|nr:hypothetical protein [Ginsengibacter hankyongi]